MSSSVGQTFPYQAADLNQDGTQGWGPLERAVLSSLIDTVQRAVTVDGLDINGDLDLQGHGLVNSAFVQMVLNGDAGMLRQQWVDSNGDLWYRNAAAQAVQVTSGGALAVSVSTGGFAGDYISTNPSGASYDNATGRFSFTTNGSNPANITAAAATFTQVTASVGLLVSGPTARFSDATVQPPSGYGLAVLNQTGSLSTVQSASFTEYIDVSKGASLLVVGSVSYGDTGWSLGAGGGQVDIDVPYQVGDRINSVAVGLTSGFPLSCSLSHRSDDGKFAIIARASFNDGVAGLHTLQAGTATMTGTLPYTPPGTGSLRFSVSTNNAVAFTTCRVSRQRKMI